MTTTTVICDYCGAAPGQPCVTASGNEARKSHATRVQVTEETATQTVIEYDYHAEAREEEGHVVAHLTEHPEKTYDPNALMVAATRDGDWEVFGPHKGTHRVSADFQTVTKGGREVSPEFTEHAHAIPAARAGAEAIRAHNAAQTAEENVLEADDVRAVARDLAARGLASYRVHESELTGETVATLTDACGEEFMIETCASGVWHDRDDQGGEGQMIPAATVWEAAQVIANVIEVAFAVNRANEEAQATELDTSGELAADDVAQVVDNLRDRGLIHGAVVGASPVTGETVAQVSDVTDKSWVLETGPFGVWTDRDGTLGGHTTPCESVRGAGLALAWAINVDLDELYAKG